jgi:NADH-quinone oxidoreductase subunit A
MLENYLPIFIFFGLAFGLSIALITVSWLRSKNRPNVEKLSPYECGFETFDLPHQNTRGRFDVRFYVVAILFIIFDLELAFLFPWAITLKKIGVFGFWSMISFLLILTIGFLYEWRKGALEWE